MKLAFLNEQKKDNQKFCEHLNQRGFMVIQEQPEQKSYDALIDSYRKLTKRSIDYLMLDQFTSDFNYFLDYLNPKEIKKQKFDVVGNGFTTTMLNYVAMLNQNIRVLYGPTFNHFTKPNEAAKIYDNFAYIISKTEKQVIIDAKKTNPDLLFAFTKKTAGTLYGGHVDALIASYNTDYFPAKLKGIVLLIDGLADDVTTLRQQLTTLNQRKMFVGVKGIIFGKVENVNLPELITEEFSELLRLNMVFDYNGINAEQQSYVMLGKQVIIDPITEEILQVTK
jgi:muramoyltetrapeptide carboxypeptidase LdcA involved in peptidoglycan recycling